MTARRPARVPSKRSKASRPAKKSKPARKAVKRAAKPSKKQARKPERKSKPRGPRITSKAKSRTVFQPMEQVTVSCVNCGREFTIVKIPGLSTEGMICSRCSFGEMQLPSD